MNTDKNYWEKYYLEHGQDNDIKHHSSFAEFCYERFFYAKAKRIVELGSGNGRDAIYFAHHGNKVVAIDQSTTAIDIERENIHNEINSNLIPIAEDFVNYDFGLHGSIDVFYSRFTLHSINKKDEDIIIPRVYNHLKKGGLFCIEVRTTKDPLCGIGENCGNNTYRTDHYRRFIDSQEFLKSILSFGFNLLFFTEENNLSVYNNDNPVLMRIILEKA